MKELWQRIENWLAENYPAGLEKLNPPATEEMIRETEEFLKVSFPDDVREFYKIHDGTNRDFGLIDGWVFHSLKDVCEQWAIWKQLLDDGELNEGDFQGNKSEPEDGIKDDWWNEKWIPLTSNGGGDHDCLDLDPTEDGYEGQIIKMWHDWESRTIVANYFEGWIEDFVQELENGQYTATSYGLSKD